MAKSVLLIMALFFVGHLNTQKLIAAYQFEKDTLFRFHYEDEVIIKNSNELRLWMEDNESAMDSTLFEYIVYQLGVLPQRLIPCKFIPKHSFSLPSFSSDSDSYGCSSGYSNNTQDLSKKDKKKEELPPCIYTELYELGIEVDFDLYAYMEANLSLEQKINRLLDTIQSGWHKEFPIRNDSFYTSVAFLETILIDEMSPILYEEETAKTLEAFRVFVSQN